MSIETIAGDGGFLGSNRESPRLLATARQGGACELAAGGVGEGLKRAR